MSKLILPKSLLELSTADRDAIVAVLIEASKLPKTKQLSTSHVGDEHNMWARNGDPLLADAEDTLYRELMDAEAESLAELFVELGLPTKGLDVEKSLGIEYLAFEDELMKAYDNGRNGGLDSGRNRMSDWINKMTKKARNRAKKWAQDGKAMTHQQMSKLDTIMKKQVPDYAKKSEDYMVRAGFIGKARGQADTEDMELLGEVLDRYPSTIKAAEETGVVMTVKQQERAAARGETVTVLPLTEREQDSIIHASMSSGDKMHEISERHRMGVRQLVMQAKRERWTAQELASKLFDKFGEHNRDWRRVAITELAFAHNDAFLAGCEEGATVIGMGAADACKHCNNLIIGKTFTVTHTVPKKETYDTDMKQVWVGKSNYGRRVSEYRVAIPLHPNCRCRYHVISRFYKLGEDGKLVLKDTAELIQEERKARGLEPDPELENKKKEPMTQEELAEKAAEVLRKLEGK